MEVAVPSSLFLRFLALLLGFDSKDGRNHFVAYATNCSRDLKPQIAPSKPSTELVLPQIFYFHIAGNKLRTDTRCNVGDCLVSS
ncbi:hypothetical protein AVEN_219902-1 [Araneus ventricosus]|uniref:Secreted protein n=1 Tax=Araneus ventricosus TaxID=182803 RepID=A0A4Y2VGF1_ARAVE|nr:hypothetical protein AVEN_219902-1 [Araneus ventricosus]